MSPGLIVVEGLTELSYCGAFFAAFVLPCPPLQVVAEADPRRAVRTAARTAGPAWVLLDIDPQAGAVRQNQLRQAIGTAEKQGITVGLSHPSFDYWLWLHGGEASAPPGPLQTRTLKRTLQRQSWLPEGYGALAPERLREGFPGACRIGGKPTVGDVRQTNPSTNLGPLFRSLLP